jgi:D-glycero-D-manno-heptose 1,7-bisphosphate phosphatase
VGAPGGPTRQEGSIREVEGTTVEAVFLDRDGVINENRPDHVKCWEEFHFLPGVKEAIARLSAAGVRLFVITNQAIVNRGIVTREVVEAVNARMVSELGACAGRIEEVAYCPHAADEACACRKPRPGLLLEVADKHAVDLRRAVLIGDAISDIAAAQAAGCEAILVLTGRGRQELARAVAAGLGGFSVAEDVSGAADLLLARVPVVA